ncbi:hypothetical protein SD1617_5910 [Shigella dysenteriae 1617]|nr:hypothetical protein SD1617_5910 [Shigella dysenteriae 1617]
MILVVWRFRGPVYYSLWREFFKVRMTVLMPNFQCPGGIAEPRRH